MSTSSLSPPATVPAAVPSAPTAVKQGTKQNPKNDGIPSSTFSPVVTPQQHEMTNRRRKAPPAPPPTTTIHQSSPPPSFLCIAMHLKKPRNATVWGMSLSLFDDSQYLILGDVQTEVLRGWMSWCQVVPIPYQNNDDLLDDDIDYSKLFRHPSTSQTLKSSSSSFYSTSMYSSTLSGYMETLGQQQQQQQQQCNPQLLGKYTSHHLQQLQQQQQLQQKLKPQRCLLPGDWILAIDGYTPNSLGGSLGNVTNHLRQVDHVTLVILRSATAVTQAMHVLRGEWEGTQNATLGAAQVAQHIWKQHYQQQQQQVQQQQHQIMAQHSPRHTFLKTILQFQKKPHHHYPHPHHGSVDYTHSQESPHATAAARQAHKSTTQHRNPVVAGAVTGTTTTKTNIIHHQNLQRPKLLGGQIPRLVTPEKKSTGICSASAATTAAYQPVNHSPVANYLLNRKTPSHPMQALAHHHHQQQQQQQQPNHPPDGYPHLHWKSHAVSSLSSSPPPPPPPPFPPHYYHRGAGETGHPPPPPFHPQPWRQPQQPPQLLQDASRLKDPANVKSNPLSPLDLLSQVASAMTTAQQQQQQRQHLHHTSIPITMSKTSTKKSAKRKLPEVVVPVLPDNWRNPLFQCPTTGLGLPYDDNWEFSPEDGSRAALFLPPINDFQQWLKQRKQQWKSHYKVYQVEVDKGCNGGGGGDDNNNNVTMSKTSTKRKLPEVVVPVLPDNWRNPLFQCPTTGLGLPYDDNWEFSPEDGSRAGLFLPPINDFQQWLKQRKQQWKSHYKVYQVEVDKGCNGSGGDDNNDDEQNGVRSLTVAHEFWKTSHNNFSTFDDWLVHSLLKWKKLYSWNQRKRKRLQEECVEVVHLTSSTSTSSHHSTTSKKAEFLHWLHIRKNQWKVLRRKRQRQKEIIKHEEEQLEKNEQKDEDAILRERFDQNSPTSSHHHINNTRDSQLQLKGLLNDNLVAGDLVLIDDMLEEEELKRKAREERPPLDIHFLFNAENGVPDDVVVHCFQFLDPMEHAKLLSIDKGTSVALQDRGEQLWRQLCPPSWVLPRRPRKAWHELYFSLLKRETLDSQKRWDGLLVKCSEVLLKGDRLQEIEKLVNKGLHVDYCSSVVCERNSLLNLAVIHQRHKVVRWLVEQKGADIETFDRGQFTPLMNAAWAGDRYLVRFFLLRGSDRTKVGLSHYSGALAGPDFRGLTAEGWAREKGHHEIEKLICVGL